MNNRPSTSNSTFGKSRSTKLTSSESSKTKASPSKDSPIANQPTEECKAVTKITKEVSNGNDSRVELDVEALKKVLKNPTWADYNVAVYSIAGPFRSGKSFLLSVLYHYYEAFFQVSGINEQNKKEAKGSRENVWHFNEMKERAAPKLNEEVAKIFAWKGGSQGYTDGIYILSQPMLIPPEKPEVALFLMDTVGLFDNQTSTQNSTFIGALSFLISSLQIFNVKGLIESIHLEEVYKFSEIARRVKGKDPIQENKRNKYFRNIASNYAEKKEQLMIVVRDWEDEEEYAFGLEGGKSYLGTLLPPEESGDTAEEHILMKIFLKDSFERVDCMLLPHPGSQIRKAKDHVVLKNLDQDFQNGLYEMFEHVVVSSYKPFIPKFYLKKIEGNYLTCRGLYHYTKAYSEILKEGVALDVESVIQSQLESKMVKHVWEGFGQLQAEIKDNIKELWDNSKLNEKMPKVLEKLEAEFESKLPSHSMKCFGDEWKKEFANLLWQIVNAVELCIAVEKLTWNYLDKCGKWRKENLSSDFFLNDEEKKLAGAHHEETTKKLNNDINTFFNSNHKNRKEIRFKKKEASDRKALSRPKTGNPPKKDKICFSNSVAKQYIKHFSTLFDKFLAEGSIEIPSQSSQFCLDLVLGDIDIRPYQDFTNQTSPSTSNGSEDLALARFSGGNLTFSYMLEKVTVPLLHLDADLI